MDRHLIGELNSAQLRLHAPREAGVALRYDKPWEGPYGAYTPPRHTVPFGPEGTCHSFNPESFREQRSNCIPSCIKAAQSLSR